MHVQVTRIAVIVALALALPARADRGDPVDLLTYAWKPLVAGTHLRGTWELVLDDGRRARGDRLAIDAVPHAARWVWYSSRSAVRCVSRGAPAERVECELADGKRIDAYLPAPPVVTGDGLAIDASLGEYVCPQGSCTLQRAGAMTARMSRVSLDLRTALTAFERLHGASLAAWLGGRHHVTDASLRDRVGFRVRYTTERVVGAYRQVHHMSSEFEREVTQHEALIRIDRDLRITSTRRQLGSPTLETCTAFTGGSCHPRPPECRPRDQ